MLILKKKKINKSKSVTRCCSIYKGIVFTELWHEFDMMSEEYIEAVRTSIIKPALFLHLRVCDIRLNNYIKYYWEFW